MNVADVDLFALQPVADRDAGLVVPDSRPEFDFSPETGSRHGGIGGHAAAGLDVLERTNFSGFGRKAVDPVDAVQGRMSDTDEGSWRSHRIPQA